MKITFISLFPEMIKGALSHGVVGQAVTKNKVDLEFVNPREFVSDVHQTVDDRPFGGGDGMIMLAGPLDLALKKVLGDSTADANRTSTRAELAHAGTARVMAVCMSARGRPLTDSLVRQMATMDQIVAVCGRYGGIDQRVINHHQLIEISLGDFVLSGGEIAAVAVADAVVRLQPGVLGNPISSQEESFADIWLEHPQFTRPREALGQAVPEPLLGGNHAHIQDWKASLARLTTICRRDDIAKRAWQTKALSHNDLLKLEKAVLSMAESDLHSIGLGSKAEILGKLHEFGMQMKSQDVK